MQKKILPKNLKPELAFLTEKAPLGNDWIHEEKFDGYRIIAFIQNNQVKLLSRNANDWSNYFPHLITALKKLKLINAILDGEIVVLDSKNISNFSLLQNAISTKDNRNIIYNIFDLPYYNNYDLRKIPLIERKKILKKILSENKNRIKKTPLRYTKHIQGQGYRVFKLACKNGLEGIISKKIDSHYVESRSKNWLKVKCVKRQEFVIGGYTKPQGSRLYFGALLVGVYNKKNKLIYTGKVGTGFSTNTLENLYKKFKKLKTNNPPFESEPDINKMKNVTWLKPKLVGMLEFIEWTNEHRLRHVSFLGLRLDKNPRQVHMEKTSKSKE